MKKMVKSERDLYVLNNKNKTIKDLAKETGWSETTIKGIRRQLGIVTHRRESEFISVYNELKDKCSLEEIANILATKGDILRDVLKAKDMYTSPSEEANISLLNRLNAAELEVISPLPFKAADFISIRCKICNKVMVKRANNVVSRGIKCCKSVEVNSINISIGEVTKQNKYEYIYFSSFGEGLVKIGKSVDVHRRLGELNRAWESLNIKLEPAHIIIGPLDDREANLIETLFKNYLTPANLGIKVQGYTELYSCYTPSLVLEHPFIAENFTIVAHEEGCIRLEKLNSLLTP